ncbi:MAG: baseplate protein, partial [Proteobacteria bacterium]|nr:baseplate protein [Pseudomonadota bacterium]
EVEKFFSTMPKLSHTIKIKNPNTKVESEVLLEGLSSFFA